jgi:hypothetical protein
MASGRVARLGLSRVLIHMAIKANGIKLCEPGRDVPCEQNTAERALGFVPGKTRPCPQQARAVGILSSYPQQGRPVPVNDEY